MLSTSSRSLIGRSGVVGADWMLALTRGEGSAPAERGRFPRGAIVSLMRSPSPIVDRPTLTTGFDTLHRWGGGALLQFQHSQTAASSGLGQILKRSGCLGKQQTTG